jgi:hypothetical protein
MIRPLFCGNDKTRRPTHGSSRLLDRIGGSFGRGGRLRLVALVESSTGARTAGGRRSGRPRGTPNGRCPSHAASVGRIASGGQSRSCHPTEVYGRLAAGRPEPMAADGPAVPGADGLSTASGARSGRVGTGHRSSRRTPGRGTAGRDGPSGRGSACPRRASRCPGGDRAADCRAGYGRGPGRSHQSGRSRSGSPRRRQSGIREFVGRQLAITPFGGHSRSRGRTSGRGQRAGRRAGSSSIADALPSGRPSR